MQHLKTMFIIKFKENRKKSKKNSISQKGIPLEMNSTHPFYPILIPNTSYVKNLLCSQFCIDSALVADAVDPETLGFTAWAPGYPKGAGDCVFTYVKVQLLCSSLIQFNIYIFKEHKYMQHK